MTGETSLTFAPGAKAACAKGSLVVLIDRPLTDPVALSTWTLLDEGQGADLVVGTFLSHGLADAQKTMGVIALTLFTATEAGVFEHVPAWMSFLVTPTKDVVPWVKVSCALVMAAGTWAGGWRIIKTLGHKMVKMKPVHGFAAETTAASILVATGAMGMPVSTTHIITTSIMGVGAAKRWNSVRWSLVERIVWAWIMTIPATALLGYVFYRIISALQ